MMSKEAIPVKAWLSASFWILGPATYTPTPTQESTTVGK